MLPGMKVQVKREGNRRRVTGQIVRVFHSEYTDTLIEYRAFHNGNIYLAKAYDVRPYDRTIRRQRNVTD